MGVRRGRGAPGGGGGWGGGWGLGLGLERLVLEAVAREIGLRLRLKGHERHGKTRDPPAS